jgi:outer membrane protein assembly factor BamA
MLRIPGAAAVALSLLCAATSAHAQDTRADTLQRERAEKAKQLRAYDAGRLEKILLYVEESNPLARIAPRNGFFVRYGYYQKPVGSGIGFGGGYRHDLFDRRARIVTEAGWTMRNYRLVRADVSMPYLADERFEVGVEATYHHRTQEDFYGAGADSLKSDRTNFRFDTKELLARAVARPRPWLAAGGHIGRISPSIGSGTDTRFPSIEERFREGHAPGLSEQPDFRYADAFAAVDYRDQPGNARAGGYYSLTLASYADLEGGTFSFRRTDLHLQQFFPIFDKKRVFAVQARVLASDTANNESVPFYFQPTIGGSTTLRGFADYRFRDRNALYLNAEYRWEAFSALDMALFSDWGKVTSRAGDLDFGDLKHAYGIGLRFNTYKTVFLRLDIGTGGGEGIRYYFKFNKAF